jgi:hypothetical protein
VKIVDDCGRGNGSVLFPVMRNGTIEEIVVVDPGFGYLNSPDGSTGGDGGTFSGPSDTIIDVFVYPPGTNVNVKPGQNVFLPGGTTVEVFNNEGEVVQTLNGLGQLSPILVESDGNFTTPTQDLVDIPTNQNPNSIGDEIYQVVVSIEDLAVLNEGISYSDGDTIQITPDNGAIIEPIINDFGNIVDVNVISGGTGFVDIPEIRVISNTGNGINAVLVPIFKFTRISDTDQLFDIPLNTPVMNVIDCVGKFPGI